MPTDDYDEKYTHPQLRRDIKDEIKAGDKGGDPGQWSARKSQLLVHEYEKRGGGYRHDKKDAAAKSLEEWSAQSWQTRDGSANADRADGMHRYLPEDAWPLLLEADQQQAEQTKAEADDKDEQFADWPTAVRDVMAELGYTHGDSNGVTKDYLARRAAELDIAGRSSMTKEELKAAILDHPSADLDDMTKEELYERAKQLEIGGRSKMDKGELREAVEGKD